VVRTRSVAGLVSTLALLACFDEPVRESVDLEFHPDGAVTATLTVELDTPSEWRGRQSARNRRLTERSRALLEGWDPSLARFERLRCASTGGGWVRSGRHLVRFSRWARCADRRAVEDLFGDLPIVVEMGGDEETARRWFMLRPLGGGVASRSERRRFDRLLESWIEGLDDYHRAAYALAQWAAERPELAEALWQAGFGEEPEEPDARWSAIEERLADEFAESLEAAASAFEAAGDEAISLDELARRVFDPLPGRLVITTPTPISDRSGFLSVSDQRVATPPSGLLGALLRLEGSWLDPDPLAQLIAELRTAEDEPLDVGRFARRDPRRRAEPPDPGELRAAIVDQLELPQEMWVVWRAPRDEAAGEAAASRSAGE
jgi:hypothetical protein